MSQSQPYELHNVDVPTGVPFPIYRSEVWHELTLDPSIEPNSNNISSIASSLWNQMDEETKEGYRQKAIAAKALHAQHFPGYKRRVRPRKSQEHVGGLAKHEMERCKLLDNLLISITVTSRTNDISKPQPYLCLSTPSPLPVSTEPNVPTINSNGVLSASLLSPQGSPSPPIPPSLDQSSLFPSSDLERKPLMSYSSLCSSFLNGSIPTDDYIQPDPRQFSSSLDTDPGTHTDLSVTSVPFMGITEFPDIPTELQFFLRLTMPTTFCRSLAE